MCPLSTTSGYSSMETALAAGPSKTKTPPTTISSAVSREPNGGQPSGLVGAPGSSSGIPLAAPAMSFEEGESSKYAVDVIPSRVGTRLCVRHKQMANQDMNRKLQKSLDALPTSERSAVTQLWSTFSNAPHGKRKLILEGILTMCCSTQISHFTDSLALINRVDPFSALPREVSMRVLGYLDAISLGRAAQVSKSWKALADDDLLWRRMCGQHIDRKCEKCGWGLPLLERRRLKVELQDGSPSVAIGVGGHHDHDHGDGHGHEAITMVTREEAFGGNVPGFEGLQAHRAGSSKRPAPLDSTGPWNSPVKRVKMQDGFRMDIPSSTLSAPARDSRMTRPWKDVYCERLKVERNWRKGRCVTKTLKGHASSVMCLQYHTTLTNPSYPVLITGSYDRTARIWNMDTGQVIRTLTGHTRAIRTLQFDQMLLFTGSTDGTVRMWNWRAGECLRVLEGHNDGVVSLNYNGYLLATGSADTTIHVWNFRTGNQFSLPGHDDWVSSVVLWDGKTSPGDMDPTQMPSFTRHRATSPDLRSTTNSNGSDKSGQPEFDPGAMLFSAGDDGIVKLWDLASKECLRVFRGHHAPVQSIKVVMVDMTANDIAAKGRRQAAQRALTPPSGHDGANDTTATNGHADSGSQSDLQTHSYFTTASQMSLSPSPPQQPANDLPLPDGFDPLAPRDDEIAGPRVFVHPSPDERKKQDADSANTRPDDDVQYIGKKAVLVSGSLDGTVKIWDVEEPSDNATLFGHIEGVWAVDMDALRLASGSHDRTIKVWDPQSGNCVQTLVGHRGAVNALQLSDDMIVSGSDDGDVMIWNFAPTAQGFNSGPLTPNTIAKA